MKKLLALLLLISTLYCTLPITAGAVTYATWNPSDTSPTISLSGGNLVATHGAVSSWQCVRGTIAPTSGKWYWEITITTQSTANASMNGVATAAAILIASDGSTANKYTYGDSDGEGWSNTTRQFSNPAAGPSQGQVIGFAYDAGAGTMQALKNNSAQGTLTSVVTSGGFPIACIFTASDVITANFGATALTYTPPSGYNSGLYSGGAAAATFNPWQFFAF